MQNGMYFERILWGTTPPILGTNQQATPTMVDNHLWKFLLTTLFLRKKPKSSFLPPGGSAYHQKGDAKGEKFFEEELCPWYSNYRPPRHKYSFRLVGKHFISLWPMKNNILFIFVRQKFRNTPKEMVSLGLDPRTSATFLSVLFVLKEIRITDNLTHTWRISQTVW